MSSVRKLKRLHALFYPFLIMSFMIRLPFFVNDSEEWLVIISFFPQ